MEDWRKDTQSLLHFPMKHGIMITDNKIELSSLSEINTQQGHQNGYTTYPLKCFTAHVCMNMIAERTQNVKRLAIFVRLSFLCQTQ
jgi:hypothetical protein